MSKITFEPTRLLLVEDDQADILLALRARYRAKFGGRHEKRMETLDYLQNYGAYFDQTKYPCADLVLLDFNFPAVDGREALRVWPFIRVP